MGDILSQSEIDDILRQLTETGGADSDSSGAEVPERKVRVFDFKRPSKFAKDQLKTINIIHDNYSRLGTNFLTAHLRTLVQVDVIAVDALPYGDFSNSLTNPDVMAIVDFSPLTGSIIFEMSPSIAFCCIDRILGGRGAAMTELREFTEIESALLERTLTQLLNVYRSSWENVISINPRLDKIETNPQFAQIVSPNEMIALVTLNVKIGDVEGMMNICIPYMVVEPIMSKLTTKFWYSLVEKEPIANAREMLERKLENTLVPVRGVLGKTNITVAEFLELTAGDVLPLERGVDEEVDVYVGELLKFKARPGVIRRKSALKVTQVFKKEDDD
ncbi:MAG: flagellar motor switch protein FliM [Clostridiales bacterium]|jgi:flagellar motor switch protein FliM|nr:flagellar motor switch protein FliM [Clostridiales bacterium]